MRYKLEGPLIKNRREKPKISYGQMIKGLAKVNGKDVLVSVQLPKPKKPYQPRPNARKPHVMREKIIEREIIKYLRGKGFFCGKINPELGGWNKGIADILCMTPSAQYWIEVKTKQGRQQQNQKDFQKLCDKGNVHYLVARSIDDVKHIR